MSGSATENLKELATSNSALLLQIDEIQQQLKDAKESHDTEVQSLNDVISALQRDVTAFFARDQNHKSSLAAIQQQLDASTAFNNELTVVVKSLKGDISHHSDAVAALTAELEAAKTSVADITASRDELSEQLQQDFVRHTLSEQQLQTSMREKSAQIDQLRAQLETTQHSPQLQPEHQAIQSIVDVNLQQQDIVDELKLQIAELEQLFANATSEIDVLKEELTSLNADKMAADDIIFKLRNTKHQQGDSHNDTEGMHAAQELQAKLDAATVEIAKLNSANGDLQQETAQQSAALTTLENELRGSQSAVAALNGQLQQQIDDIASLKSNAEAVTKKDVEAHAHWEQTVNDLQATIAELQQRREQLSNTFNQETLHLKSQLSTVTDANTTLQNQLQTLTDDMRVLKEAEAETRQQLSAKVAELDVIKQSPMTSPDAVGVSGQLQAAEGEIAALKTSNKVIDALFVAI